MKPLLHIVELWRARFALLAAGLGLSLVALASGVAMLTLSGSAIAAVLTGGFLSAPLWLRVLGPVRVILRYLERLVTHGATFRALADLRVWFFRGLAAGAAGGLGFRQAGDVLQRLVGDVEALDGLYLRILLPLAGAMLLVPAAGIVAGRLSALCGVAVAVLFGTAAFAMPALAARAAQSSGGQLAQAAAKLRIAALDALTGLREVRAFGAEARMVARAGECERALVAAQRELARRTAWANAGALLCGQAALLAVLLAAGAAPAFCVAACFLIVAAFEPLAALPRAGVAAGAASASAARVLAMGRAPALADPRVMLRTRRCGARVHAVLRPARDAADHAEPPRSALCGRAFRLAEGAAGVRRVDLGRALRHQGGRARTLRRGQIHPGRAGTEGGRAAVGPGAAGRAGPG